MVHYSIDTNPRPRVHFWIAALSLLASLALPLLIESVAHRILVPSAFALYGALILLYDRLPWRIRPFSYAAAVPNISGHYRGTVAVHDGTVTREGPVEALVTQTWSKIEIVVESAHTVSTLVICGFFVENSDNLGLVCTYLVRERAPNPSHNTYGEGTQELRIQKGKLPVLSGPYYSTKRHRGTLRLEKLRTPRRSSSRAR